MKYDQNLSFVKGVIGHFHVKLIREMKIGLIDCNRIFNTLSKANNMVTTCTADCQQFSVKILVKSVNSFSCSSEKGPFFWTNKILILKNAPYRKL